MPGRMGIQVHRIVILGGGTAGWMCAAAFSRLLRAPGYSVRLIESDDIGTVGVGEATLPHIKDFNDQLGINEAAFMRATQATFKLGIEFRGWGASGAYVHPFGAFGQDWAGIGFHHYWRRARKAGIPVGALEDYSIAIAAARAYRFDFPTEDANSLRSHYAYAYHFDAGLYALYLRKYSEALGVKRTEGKIVKVNQRATDGFIEGVVLESGAVVEGELFIDCSGMRALLIEQTLGAGYEDWSHWLPCDRAIAMPSQATRPITPYTLVTARAAGWTWRIPLQSRIGNGYVYASRFCDDETARRTLVDAVDSAPVAEPRQLSFTPGRRREPWLRNCLSLGLASGFLEPLESTSIHLIQRAILRLIRMLPQGRISERDIMEFNDQQDQDMVQIRDFLILHYHVTERRDSLFWRHCASMPIPDSLTQKIELFRETGRVFRRNEELFAENSWVQVMMGQGIMPRSYHPIAGKLTEDELNRLLTGLRESVTRTAASLPEHAAYVAQYCAI